MIPFSHFESPWGGDVLHFRTAENDILTECVRHDNHPQTATLKIPDNGQGAVLMWKNSPSISFVKNGSIHFILDE